VLLIFAYTVLWWVAFFFVDNIFYDRAFVQFPDANQLTAFIGRLLSIIGIVALLSSTVVTAVSLPASDSAWACLPCRSW